MSVSKEDVVGYLEAWIADEPAETSQPFIDLDGAPLSLQQILVHVKEETLIGVAFMKCMGDVDRGLI